MGDCIGGPFAIHLALTALHRDGGCVVIEVNVDAVFAGPSEGKSQVGCIDFETLVRPHAAHPHLQGALGQAHLCNAVVEIEQRDAGCRSQAYRCTANLQLGARVGGGPDPVTGGQGPVDDRLKPVAVSSGRNTDRAARITQARNTRGGIGTGPSAGEQQGQTHAPGHCLVSQDLNCHKVSFSCRRARHTLGGRTNTPPCPQRRTVDPRGHGLLSVSRITRASSRLLQWTWNGRMTVRWHTQGQVEGVHWYASCVHSAWILFLPCFLNPMTAPSFFEGSHIQEIL